MRTLTTKYYGGNPIGEDEFNVDIQVVDKYVSFSTEILRLALLGIAAYGFLISDVILGKNSHTQVEIFDPFIVGISADTALLIGLFALGISALTAVSHRYYAADCVTHFVRRIRAVKIHKEMPADDPQSPKLLEIMKHEQVSLDRDVEFCRWFLIFSTACLVIGALSFVLGFLALLQNVGAT